MQVVASVGGVFDGEGRRFARVQHGQPGDIDLDFTRGELKVLRFPLAHEARRLDDELAAEPAGGQAQVRIRVHVERQLRDAVAVADVHEGHAAEVAGALDPSAEDDGGADVVGAKFAAGMGAVHVRGIRVPKFTASQARGSRFAACMHTGTKRSLAWSACGRRPSSEVEWNALKLSIKRAS
jgi:hypothetical protein